MDWNRRAAQADVSIHLKLARDAKPQPLVILIL